MKLYHYAPKENTVKEMSNEIVFRKHFCVCSRPVALIRLRLRSPAHLRASFTFAHDVRRLSAMLTDIPTSLSAAPHQTRSLACSQLIAYNLQTKKATFSGDFFLFVVGATRFEHATSWSQTKRSTRLSYAPSTDLVITTYFSILQALFYFFLNFVN